MIFLLKCSQQKASSFKLFLSNHVTKDAAKPFICRYHVAPVPSTATTPRRWPGSTVLCRTGVPSEPCCRRASSRYSFISVGTLIKSLLIIIIFFYFCGCLCFVCYSLLSIRRTIHKCTL